MSLVNEALRKARLEAARQEDRRQGVPQPAGPQPRPRRGPSPLLMAAFAAVAVAGAGLIFYAGRHSAAPPEPTQPTAEATPVASSAGAPQPELRAERPAVAVEPPPPAVEQPPTTASPAPAARPQAEGSAASPPPAAAPARPAPPPAATPETSPPDPAPRITVQDRTPNGAVERPITDTSPAQRTFVRQANTGAGRLELGGIAYSENRPFALINGEVVAPGEAVLGYTVVRIFADRVELRDDTETLVLALR